MTRYTENLCEFIAKLDYQDLSPDLINKAKILTMHVVGSALAGRMLPTAVSARDTAQEIVGKESAWMSTIWGDDGKMPMYGAIMANATAADTLDWEDCSYTGHPSAHLIPVSMAMSEAMHLSGKDYLTAVIGGYEVYQRVAAYVYPMPGYDGLKFGGGLGSWQIYASAVSAGKLLNCDSDQFNLLLGAAGCSTPVVNAILAQQGSDFYHLQYGITGITGTMVASMAKKNQLDNIYNIMDGESGYPMMIRGYANENWINRNLGTEYLFRQLLIKHWPANMWIQVPLDCLDILKKEYGFAATDIEEIYLTPGFRTRDKFSWDGYQSCRDAQFSIPYCLAAYMLRGAPGPEWYTPDRLADPDLLNLASRIKLDKENVLDLPVAFKMFMDGSFPSSQMRLTLTDGRILETSLQFPKGHPNNPLTWEDVEPTFVNNARAAGLSEQNITRFQTLCRDLEHLSDLSDLAQCLAL